MIQRKQTIYLLLAFICDLLLMFFPIFTISGKMQDAIYAGSFGANGIQGEEYSQQFPVYLLFISMSLLTAMGIALFKNRRKQLMICRINLIFHVLVAIALTIFYYVGSGMILDKLTENGYSDTQFGVGIGFFLCVAAIPFILLAIRGIRGDEALLQSIDRIR